tara:strand:+ start:331 stop:999 length:669 start_codon:yes stop_codon:yes gene_type:complete
MLFYIRKILRFAKRLLDPLFSKNIDYFLWKYKHLLLPKRLNEFGDNKIDNKYQIFQIIKSKESFESLLDVGCGAAVTLDKLSNIYPSKYFCGIDINNQILKLNRIRVKKEIKNNLEFFNSDIYHLDRLEPNSFDIVLVEGVFLYINPKDLEKIILNLIKIAKKTLILRQISSKKVFYDDIWHHNFPDLFKKLAINNYKTIKVFDQPGEWSENGFIYDISIVK